MTESVGFGDRVLQARLDMAARLRRTVSQVEVGKAMGVTGVAVGSWEKNEKVPDLETIQRLARFLGVSPGYLAFGEGATLAPGSHDDAGAKQYSDAEIAAHEQRAAAVAKSRKRPSEGRRKRA